MNAAKIPHSAKKYLKSLVASGALVRNKGKNASGFSKLPASTSTSALKPATIENKTSVGTKTKKSPAKLATIGKKPRLRRNQQLQSQLKKVQREI